MNSFDLEHSIANLVVSHIRFNAYGNGMGTSLIASLATHSLISHYVTLLLAPKSHSSHHKKYLTKIPIYWKMVSYPLIKEGQWSHKYAFLSASGVTLLCLGASLKRVNGAIILENGLVAPCSILLHCMWNFRPTSSGNQPDTLF